MNKSAVKPHQIAVMIAFALSCFGLLLYLWSSFGGAVPLRAKPYQVVADFRQGAQLASYADVRISGVTIGKAAKIERDGKVVRTTLNIEPQFAPLPVDTKATLWTKTVVGETFITLSFGNRAGPKIPDGGRIAPDNIKDTVELDQVLDVFDRESRPRFQRLIASFATSLRGHGTALNSGLGSVRPTLAATRPVLDTLDRQDREVRSTIRDLGATFGAVGEDQAAVQGLLRSGREVLASTAVVDRPLRRTVRRLPATVDQVRRTLRIAQATARDARPAVDALTPVAPLVEPALRNLDRLSPDLLQTVNRLDPTIDLVDTGFPKLGDTFDALGPFARAAVPVTDSLLPALRYLRLYERELGVTFANSAAATQSQTPKLGGGTAHTLRIDPPINSETLMGQVRKAPGVRSGPYPLPGGLRDIAALKASDCANARNPPVLLSVLDFGGPTCRAQKPLTFDGRTALFPPVAPQPADR